LADIVLPITMTTDASGTVTSCHLGADPTGLDYDTLCTQMFHGTVQTTGNGNGNGNNGNGVGNQPGTKYCVLPTPSPAPNGNGHDTVSITCTFAAGAAGWQSCDCPNQNPNVTGWLGSNCEQSKPGRWGCFQANGTSKGISVYMDGTAASSITIYCKM
jgi:hypothetical protein